MVQQGSDCISPFLSQSRPQRNEGQRPHFSQRTREMGHPAVALLRITRQELHDEQHEVEVSMVFQFSGPNYRERLALADDDSIAFQSSTSGYIGIVGFPPPQLFCGVSVKRNQV